MNLGPLSKNEQCFKCGCLRTGNYCSKCGTQISDVCVREIDPDSKEGREFAEIERQVREMNKRNYTLFWVVGGLIVALFILAKIFLGV